MDQSHLEEMFNHPGWEVFSKELQALYENSDMIVHTPSRKDDREVHIGKCEVVKDIFSMVKRFKVDFDATKKES
jgi:hypothetical protein